MPVFPPTELGGSDCVVRKRSHTEAFFLLLLGALPGLRWSGQRRASPMALHSGGGGKARAQSSGPRGRAPPPAPHSAVACDRERSVCSRPPTPRRSFSLLLSKFLGHITAPSPSESLCDYRSFLLFRDWAEVHRVRKRWAGNLLHPCLVLGAEAGGAPSLGMELARPSRA